MIQFQGCAVSWVSYANFHTHLIMMEENINKAADFGARKHFSIAATWSTLLGFNTETTATKMTLRVQGT